jgi:hypothetical protein
MRKVATDFPVHTHRFVYVHRKNGFRKFGPFALYLTVSPSSRPGTLT